MNAKKLEATISYVLWAHSMQATTARKSVRKWDGKTPYGIHPIWCAMTILSETSLPEELRMCGAEALLLHDLLEDTEALLPHGTSDRVKGLVEGMTFRSSSEEMERVWSRGSEVLLLKLYDKVSNLLDGSWMSTDKRATYRAYVERLCDEVSPVYGKELNIVKIAKAVTKL